MSNDRYVINAGLIICNENTMVQDVGGEEGTREREKGNERKKHSRSKRESLKKIE